MGLQTNTSSLDRLPRGAEPRTKQAGMHGRLMMCMMGRMLGTLCSDYPAYVQQDDREADGQSAAKYGGHIDSGQKHNRIRRW